MLYPAWVVKYMAQADFDCVLCLGLIEVGEGGGGYITLKSVQLFSLSGDSKQKKIPTKKSGTTGGGICGGHHPKVPLFFDAAP